MICFSRVISCEAAVWFAGREMTPMSLSAELRIAGDFEKYLPRICKEKLSDINTVPRDRDQTTDLPPTARNPVLAPALKV